MEEHAREEHINKLHQVIERHDPDPYARKRVMNFSVWDTLPTEDTFKEWLLNGYNNVPPDGIECDDQVTLLVDSFRRLDQIMRDPDKRWHFDLPPSIILTNPHKTFYTKVTYVRT